MTDEQLLAMLKMNLEIVTSNESRNLYLTQLISTAKSSIAREGILLDGESIEDNNLIVMYAAYLYRQRVTVGAGNVYNTAAYSAEGMPRMLRYALNNRLLSQKMRVET